MTHGFDEFRRHIDKDGKRCISWSNDALNMFNKRSECLIEQYNNYTITQVNLQVYLTILFKYFPPNICLIGKW